MRLLQITLCFSLILFLTAVASAKIVFCSYQDKSYGIYTMNDNGSNITQITSFPKWEILPRWSPDGQQIAFLRNTNPSDPIMLNTFIMNADGTNVRQLTNHKEGSYNGLAFSPDGTKLIVSRRINTVGEKSGLYLVDIKTAAITKISNIRMSNVDWSPDGKEIIFVNTKHWLEEHNLWIMNADGTDARPWIIERRNMLPGRPRWSPNGQHILYTETDLHIEEKIPENGGKGIQISPAGTYRYNIRNVNGGALQTLDIPKDWMPHSVAWMNRGRSVLFSAYDDFANQKDPNRSSQLYRYDLASQQITQLTHNLEAQWNGDWISDKVYAVSPAGKYPLRWGELKKTYPLINSRPAD